MSSPASRIGLVAQSEYLRRVRTKTFVLTTLLAPLLLVGAIALPAVVTTFSFGDDATQRLVVVDETGRLEAPLREALPASYETVSSEAPLDSLRNRVLREEIDAVFVLPSGLLDGSARATYYSRGGGGLTRDATLRDALSDVVRDERLRQAGLSDSARARVEQSARLESITLSDEGESADGALASSAVGYTLGMMLYIAIFLYGVLVMRGVIEEKANRIVEVIVSSVRPFELMMGKVLGIGAVGLTQLAAWGLLLVAATVAVGPLLALFLSPDATQQAQAAAAQQDLPFDPASLTAVFSPGLLIAFVAFFFGGYLLYASVYAAVGSAVEQESDAQTLQAPVMLPIMLPIFFLPAILTSPNSALAVTLSILPFSSPILMTVRMAVTSVPLWQIALALALLLLAFVAMIWVAARIYRVGILMYGKKVTFRDLIRWARVG